VTIETTEILVLLTPGELARIDGLAEVWALTREQMIAGLVRIGLKECEGDIAKMRAHERSNGGSS
jgi:hypothetical protein